MKTEDVVGLVITGMFVAMLVLESLVPARHYPKRTLWRVRGVLQFVAIAVIATLLPMLLPTKWVETHRLLHLESIGVLPGVLLGWLVLSFANYLWHRSTHRFDVLWRVFHQLHHAPQRLDIAGSTLFHPFDIVTYILISTVVTTLVIGLSAEASATVAIVAQFYAYFQHLNVKTPSWLGYLIQRPEAHFIHHQRDVHGYNYGDLPLWDLLFGTFKNPTHFGAGDVGFEHPHDGRYGAMLAFRDVSQMASEASKPSQQQPPR